MFNHHFRHRINDFNRYLDNMTERYISMFNKKLFGITMENRVKERFYINSMSGCNTIEELLEFLSESDIKEITIITVVI